MFTPSQSHSHTLQGNFGSMSTSYKYIFIFSLFPSSLRDLSPILVVDIISVYFFVAQVHPKQNSGFGNLTFPIFEGENLD